MELTEKQYEIFKKIKNAWEKRVGIGKEEEAFIKEIIILADTHKDGLKRVSLIDLDKVYLVPIEDIILYGLKSSNLEKYQTEE